MTLLFYPGATLWRVDLAKDSGKVVKTFTMRPEDILAALITLGIGITATDPKVITKAFKQAGKRTWFADLINAQKETNVSVK